MMRNSQRQRAINTALAMKLIGLGCRLQLLEVELPDLSRESLLDLYKEEKGDSPPKGMLPYAPDWFMTWAPNLHASLFCAYHKVYAKYSGLSKLEILIKAYEMYLREVSRHDSFSNDSCTFSITRAWTLTRWMSAHHPIIILTPCKTCSGEFLVLPHMAAVHYRNLECGYCHWPARAGKTKRLKELQEAQAV